MWHCEIINLIWVTNLKKKPKNIWNLTILKGQRYNLYSPSLGWGRYVTVAQQYNECLTSLTYTSITQWYKSSIHSQCLSPRIFWWILIIWHILCLEQLKSKWKNGGLQKKSTSNLFFLIQISYTNFYTINLEFHYYPNKLITLYGAELLTWNIEFLNIFHHVLKFCK